MKRPERHTLKTAARLIIVLVGVLYVAPPTANSMSSGIVRLPKQAVDGLLALPATPEALLIKALQEIRANRLDLALKSIEALLEDKPNFRLANLIKGDLLLARGKPIASFGSASGAQADTLQDLRHEAMVRLSRYQAPPPADAVPAELVQLSPEQQYALLVDTSRSRLYVYQNDNGVPRYRSDFYITIGKKGFIKTREGDQRTPLGVYRVTGKLERARLDQIYGKSAELYGIGAWPLSYPNAWDKRQGRTGKGIWLHGVPYETYSRAPLASNGCVVLTNQDMETVGNLLKTGTTPVVISNGVTWLSQADWQRQRGALMQQVEHWRRDWESLDVDRYLDHYSPNFEADDQKRDDWSQQKRQINAGKAWAKVTLSNVSVIRYPGVQSMAEVTFDQDYESSNLVNKMKKRQYWLLEQGKWKIVYEGQV
ncbi:L,D-transpeptidase family protein [Chitinivorax sp. PXF-14]|uniref:L,D-transpeptidase family protein n=1 Tax=Chitinivorax sp. PXF-14 TaxID=3230488 RepID=UPI003467DFE7